MARKRCGYMKCRRWRVREYGVCRICARYIAMLISGVGV